MNKSVSEKILERVVFEVNVQGRKKSVLGKFLGYGGSTQSKINSVSNILNGKKLLNISLLNKISEFLMLPVGYFLFGDKKSEFLMLNENFILQNIKQCFNDETKQKKIGRKKYQLGGLLGGGGDETAKIQTVNRILQRKKKITIADLEIIAQFFEKPVEWFLQDNLSS